MDRPLGSKHPEHGFFYPINYGYIEGTVSGDGEEIDAYVLGEFEPLEVYEGKVIGVIKRFNDIEDKLVVAKELNSYDKNQIKALTEFQERYFDIEIITFDYIRSSIRNTVRALFRKGKEILVLEEKANDNVYCHLPGGSIEFQETSEAALIREIKEELEEEINNIKPFQTIDNIFEIDGMIMTGDLISSKVKWININEFKDGSKILYPEGLVKFL